MNCPCNDATCAVFSTKVNHEHILLIPKLGHTKEIQRTHRFEANKIGEDSEKTTTYDEQINMRELYPITPTQKSEHIDKSLKRL